MSSTITTARVLLGLLLVTGVGCDEETLPPPPPAPPADAAGAAPEAGGPVGAKGRGKGMVEPPGLPPLPVADIQERDFLESPTNRDPFRNFTDLFVVKKDLPTKGNEIQRDVLVPKYSLEELKVVGIVTGTAGRVLVTDPGGLGWVLRVGDFVGRSENVRSGGTGGGETAVNWRLDRIRQNDVVFVRETPDPSAPSTTRVLSLRTQDELRQEIRTGIRGTRPDDESAESSDDAGRQAKPPARR